MKRGKEDGSIMMKNNEGKKYKRKVMEINEKNNRRE